MTELPTDLYSRCYDLLSLCDKFDSNESVKDIFLGTEIARYADYIHDKSSPPDRIGEVIRALKDSSYREGISVLAKFLEALAQRYPPNDDTRKALTLLAHDTQAWKQANGSSWNSMKHTPYSHDTQHVSKSEKSKQVLVIWGQNEAAKIEIFEFLRGANLSPVEWSSIDEDGASVNEALKAAFNTVQAVIVVLTGDEMARPNRLSTDQNYSVSEKTLEPQPGLDTLFKAGVACGLDQTRTILVALGNVKTFDPLLERHVIRLTNKDEDRKSLIAKLGRVGCTITGNKWIVKGNFHNPSFF